MSNAFTPLCRTARSLGLVTVGVLSTLGALSLTHIGSVQAQAPSDSLALLAARLNADEATIAALKANTSPLSVSGTDLTITGVNVHIVDGTGSTSDETFDQTGRPVLGKTLIGLGNLIIGYNENGNSNRDRRTGSHNLIVGDGNSYTSYGGFAAGYGNTLTGRYASVSGGFDNIASGYGTSVSGGESNKASGRLASISGGCQGISSGDYASISAGLNNKAAGGYSSVNGGDDNSASGTSSSIAGGLINTVTGSDSTISGGSRCTVKGGDASISGGRSLSQNIYYGWTGGKYHTP